jgi:hypothetical protein
MIYTVPLHILNELLLFHSWIGKVTFILFEEHYETHYIRSKSKNGYEGSLHERGVV